jgi:hypothetical protein
MCNQALHFRLQVSNILGISTNEVVNPPSRHHFEVEKMEPQGEASEDGFGCGLDEFALYRKGSLSVKGYLFGIAQTRPSHTTKP